METPSIDLESLDTKTREGLTLLRTMLGADVNDAILLHYLDGAGGNIETAVNHYFATDGNPNQDIPLEHDTVGKNNALLGNTTVQGEKPRKIVQEESESSKSLASIGHTPESEKKRGQLPRLNMQVSTDPSLMGQSSGRESSDSKSSPRDNSETPTEDEEYEVTLNSKNPMWTLLSIFGRAVVQSVDVCGPAAALGIQRSDVLISCGGQPVDVHSASAVVDSLTSGELDTPIVLRFRRANQSPRTTFKEVPGSPIRPPVQPSPTNVTLSMRATGPEGLQKTLNRMKDAVGVESPEEILIFFLANAGGDPERAVDLYFSADGMMPDFRGIVGGTDNIPGNDPNSTMDTWETYHVELPPGPFGMTVDNVLERTIVVELKEGGSAQRAGVVENSLLVAVNDRIVTDLTHKETLQEIETAKRPLRLEFRRIPEEQMNRLRAQLALSVRQFINPGYNKRMQLQHVTFRDIVPKVSQILLAMPRSARRRLCEQLDILNIIESDVQNATSLVTPQPSDFMLEDFDGRLDDNYMNLAMKRGQESQKVAESRMLRKGSFSFDESDPTAVAELDTLLSLYKQIHNVPEDEQEAIVALVEVLGSLGEAFHDRLETPKSVVSSPGMTLLQSPARQPSPQQFEAMHRDRSVSFTRDLDPRLLGLVLSVLESLITIENHVIWDVAVQALQKLGSRIPEVEVSRQFVPLIARLSVANNFTSRVATAALFPVVYPHVSNDVKVQLRGLYDRICNDDSAIVRRGAAHTLAQAAEAVGVESVSWVMLMFEKLASDQHDIVRGFSVDNCVKLSIQLPTAIQQHAELHPAKAGEWVQTCRLVKMRIVPVVSNCAMDSAYEVRIKIVSRMGELVKHLGHEYVDVLVDAFIPLLRDQHSDIRSEAAGRAWEVCEALCNLAQERVVASESGEPVSAVQRLFREYSQPLGLYYLHQKISNSILPVLAFLVSDQSIDVRNQLAISVGRLVPILGKRNTAEHLVPIILQLFEDPSPMVQSALAKELACHGDNLDNQIIADYLLPVTQGLASHRQWRTRAAALDCVSELALSLSNSGLPPGFASLCLTGMNDAVHEVRCAAVNNLVVLAKACGTEWLNSQVLPFLLNAFQLNYRYRMVAMEGVRALADTLDLETAANMLLPVLIAAAHDRVPNVRLKSCETLAVLYPKFEVSSDTAKQAKDALELLLKDNDMDVRWYAATALEQCGSNPDFSDLYPALHKLSLDSVETDSSV